MSEEETKVVFDTACAEAVLSQGLVVADTYGRVWSFAQWAKRREWSGGPPPGPYTLVTKPDRFRKEAAIAYCIAGGWVRDSLFYTWRWRAGWESCAPSLSPRWRAGEFGEDPPYTLIQNPDHLPVALLAKAHDLDEEPDPDPHRECRERIHDLEADNAILSARLDTYRDNDDRIVELEAERDAALADASGLQKP